MDDKKKRKQINNRWTKLTAGGCSNSPSWRLNPQYKLVINEADTVLIMLAQPEQRTRQKKPYAHIGLYLARSTPASDFRKLTLSPTDLISGNRFVDSREFTMEQSLESGEYIMIPCTFLPGIELPFYLTTYSNTDATIVQMKEWNWIYVDVGHLKKLC
jgi:hypothetical protein